MNTAEWSTRTFGNEDRLPRVPLPSLDDTCARFLDWCAPLLTDEQLAATRAAVAEFRSGPGPVLHETVGRYDTTPGVRSWLDAFWPQRYLGRRDRIALNANFFFLFHEAELSATAGPERQVERAARLIAAAVDYKRRLDDEAIPPIVTRGQAQTMEQNKFLFSETRIPHPVQDTVRVPYTPQWPGPSTERHIVVFVRGNALRMDVIAPGGDPYTVDDLADGLRAALAAGATAAGPGVGALTTKARAEWAASRDALRSHHPDNAAALDTIERALFCVCLDDGPPVSTLDACDRLLYGEGANRWYDKAVSFIVFEGGTAGINVEHCGLDGTTILSFVDTLLSAPAAVGAPSVGRPALDPVRFVLDDALRADISAAGAAFQRYGADTASMTVSFDDFGTNAAKALGVSPDGFVQMAYQLAHQRAKGFVGATYESIATRQYQNGRTEAMRVVTPEVVRFVSTMDDPAAGPDERRAAVRTAAAAHVDRARQCQVGQAPEQHLWVLLQTQQRHGVELDVTEAPALFASPGWTIMRDDYLSTSSAPSVHIQYFGFGSTSGHCIGVAYVLLPDRFNLYLSTPRAVAADLGRFADELRRAVAELRELLADG